MQLTRHPKSRHGFTLVELLVVLVLLGVVAGGMLGIIVRQQRFYTGSSGVIDTRSSVRQGVDVLESALRGISPRGNDIQAMGRTFIEFRVPTGASVLCAFGATRNLIIMPPAELSKTSGITSWVNPPVLSDSVLIYDSNRKTGTADDTWDPNAIDATPAKGAATCPTTTGLTSTAGEAASSWLITLRDTLPSTVIPGAAIRFFRPARFELYQASDRKWYLGYRDCMAAVTPSTTCTISPVSGPYLPAAATGPSGLELTYYDGTGAQTAVPSQVRRIGIVMRAQSASSIDIPGRPSGPYGDSLSTTVAIRN
jgi:prepilin-type N-terminal cleavage/methylation domain-containing protein